MVTWGSGPWAKEDEQYRLQDRSIPWGEFENQQERDYVRARYNTDPETQEFVTEPVVKELEIKLDEQGGT